MIDGKPVTLVVGQRKRKKRKGHVIYDELIRQAIRTIWELFDFMYGKRLAVLIRLNIEILKYQPELHIDDEVREKLLAISPATIDRLQSRTISSRARRFDHTSAGNAAAP
ncbi:MAG: hypothetical protein AB1798_03600 [Spirochaetota bacterium]